MSDDPTSPTDSIDSADQSDPARHRSTRRGLTALGAAVALVVAGVAGAALAGGTGFDPALSAGSSATATADEDADDLPAGPLERLERLKDWAGEHRGGMFPGRGHAFGHGRLGLGLGLAGGALHGTFVVPDPDGGYRTLVTQRGEATAASATSLTVKSEDGFTTTYRLTDDTVVLGGPDGAAAVEEGDQVAVTGVTSGGTTRALDVADLTRIEDLFRERHGPQPDPSTTTEGTAAKV